MWQEGHDNIVEEMLRKMMENNLFVKLEKSLHKITRLDLNKEISVTTQKP